MSKPTVPPLPARLAAAVSLMQAAAPPPWRRAVDVATDHALLPSWLAGHNLAADIWGLDLRSGPLERAKANLARFALSDRVHLDQGDGLDSLPPLPGDRIFITGLGGLEIIDIIFRPRWPEDCLLLLQPMKSWTELNLLLTQLGWQLRGAALTPGPYRILPLQLWQPLALQPDLTVTKAVSGAVMERHTVAESASADKQLWRQQVCRQLFASQSTERLLSTCADSVWLTADYLHRQMPLNRTDFCKESELQRYQQELVQDWRCKLKSRRVLFPALGLNDQLLEQQLAGAVLAAAKARLTSMP
ncbi:SAM-dependent methyltransferase [Oscillospiraceae bacterium HV4-5-C5C]|nr:SAM-dependent methyltransferase [Oscillospiraceae bacterium HV4-5-C5C]